MYSYIIYICFSSRMKLVFSRQKSLHIYKTYLVMYDVREINLGVCEYIYINILIIFSI